MDKNGNKKDNKKDNKNTSHILHTIFAAVLAEVVTLPICMIKTNYQNNSNKSIAFIINQIYQKGGWSSFYVASIPAVLTQIFSVTSKYFLYRYFEEKDFKYSCKILNGVTAGIITSLITHPIDSVRIHLQMDKCKLHEIFQLKNILYRGYSKSFSKTVLGGILFFPLYDYTHSIFQNSLYASFTTALTSTIIIHPVDYLKVRHIYGLPLYQGYNPKTYYKGLSLNLARTVPHFIIIMTTLDYLSKVYV